MATLINLDSGESITLLPDHIFGRHSGCNTLLLNQQASRLHATIAWDGEFWAIKDTSTNGTYINEKQITVKGATRLHKGDKIHFGSLNNHGWQIQDLSPPYSTLQPVTPGLPVIPLTGVVALPSEETPSITLYQSVDGQWLSDSESGISVLKSGDLLDAHGKIWRYVEATPYVSTMIFQSGYPPKSNAVVLNFKVSQNEEHVSLSICAGTQSIDLGERSHHYLMLILARKRLSDIASNINENEQGWLNKEQLSKMVGLGINHINIQCYRFRKSIADLFPPPFSLLHIIESRQGELRLKCDDINIVGGLSFKSH